MKPVRHYEIALKDARYIPTDGNTCLYSKRWKQMIRKCYAKSNIKNGFSVCDDWLFFSRFRAWMKNQQHEGNILSVNIIDPDNKEYGPAMCAFINKDTHDMIAEPTIKGSRLPRGVSFNKDRKKFKASCSYKGKNIYLGSYDMPPEAHEAYCKYKSEILREAAADQVDLRVSQALIDRANSYFISFLQ